MKLSFVRKTAVFAFALVLVAGLSALAVRPTLEIESIIKVQSAASDQLLPFTLATEQHTFRFRGAESKKWTLHLDTAARGSKGNIAWRRPAFRGTYVAPPATFDVWGGGYNLGGAKSDPAELIVLGSAGMRPFAFGGVTNTVDAGQAKIRSSFKVAGANITTDVHAYSSSRTNVEIYGDYKLDAATVGGVLRAGIESNSAQNTTGLVGFVKTDLSGVDLGASAGVRFGDSIDGDNLAFGLKAETKLQDNQLVLAGEVINRQKNFYESKAQDASFQNGVERFKNTSGTATGAGNLIRFTGTWLGEANKSRPLHNVLHATDHAVLTNLKGPAFQAIIQSSKDNSAEPQTMLVARAGTRFLENNFWAVGEVKITNDKDGVGSIDGVSGKDTRTDIRGRIRYNLKDAGFGDWFALGVYEYATTKDAADKVGSTNKFAAELWYDTGKLRLINGLSSSGAASATKRDNRLYSEFRLKY